MAVIAYEFRYETPTQSFDADGNPVTTNVPTTFALSGISEDVARGVRRGLRNVTTITNVTVSRLDQTASALSPDTP